MSIMYIIIGKDNHFRNSYLYHGYLTFTNLTSSLNFNPFIRKLHSNIITNTILYFGLFDFSEIWYLNIIFKYISAFLDPWSNKTIYIMHQLLFKEHDEIKNCEIWEYFMPNLRRKTIMRIKITGFVFRNGKLDFYDYKYIEQNL